MAYFTTQLAHLLGVGSEQVMFKFGVVLMAIFLFAITVIESGTRRNS